MSGGGGGDGGKYCRALGRGENALRTKRRLGRGENARVTIQSGDAFIWAQEVKRVS